MKDKNILRKKLLSLPILYFFIFSMLPIYGLSLAFKDFSFSKGIFSTWNGLGNFRYILLEEPNFYGVLKNTLWIGSVRSCLLFFSSMGLVFMIDQYRSKSLKSWILSLLLFPQFLSWVVVAGIFRNIFSLDGIVNHLLLTKGLTESAVSFLTEPSLFIVVLYMAIIWKEIGLFVFLLYVALAGIDTRIYEAARLDGATELQTVLHIKMPLMKGQIILVACLILVNFASGAFEPIFNLYNASVYDAVDILDTYIYRTGIVQGKFSIGAAMDLIKNLINLSVILVGYVIIFRGKSDLDEEIFV